MKLTSTLLLLVAGSFCLFHGCTGGVVAVPKDVVDDWKADDHMSEQINTLFERNLYVAPIKEDASQVIMPAEVEEDYVEPEPISEVEDELVQPEVDVNGKIEGRASECKVTIRGGLPTPQPLYLKSGSEEIYPYDTKGVMVVDAGSTLEMWCPGKFTTLDTTLVTATCVSGTNFRVDGTTYAFKELTCKAWPTFVAEKTGASCNGGVMVRVGFKISSSRFAQQYEVCFNEGEEVTRYVHHDLNPGANYYQTGVDRITFQTGGFFDGKSVDKLYTQATQLATINEHLGGDASKYFDSAKNVFLARGHMAAKADFDYGLEQRASFLFINAAPQWQVFNAGNWASIEDGVRAKVTSAGWYVDCYTGVYGVTTLPNSDGVQTPLYLAYDSNNNGLIPVPKLYFRVVIEKTSKKGIVFIGVNNPHLTLDEIKKDYILCTDIADQVNYISWKRTDLTAGYSYACEVSDFRSKVTNLPNLSATGGLLL
ncbi:uncharacterized protein LOC126762763 isoform X3 [Bactrocera neohumeralis]|uniref:uncharacterized protein LOC126762763 isoform X1 n=1 Tax=Bactrocera neohumeralis TaxID=98809 RepID=UPI0021667F99|nr:uncharacterized protein LOC126762763 isoform X1 [Bactrocera neohumeralis]XP_050335743.1 uncharacterized protein LOC126762763 isoform X3 [Bactrocera neohumeralis]